MCGLFGFYNYGGKPVKDLKTLTNSLAREALVRGTDATGIAYCDDGKLVIHKEPKSAVEIDFKHPNTTIAVMGHTRHATQGKESCNFNNHPFSGTCKNMNFALAHNGVLSNDRELKLKFNLPKTKIETDSYVAVQLLRHRKKLNIKNLKFMAEQVKGSFAFTVLGTDNVLRFIRGDSPLSLFHFPTEKIYEKNESRSNIEEVANDVKLSEFDDFGFFDKGVKQKACSKDSKIQSGDFFENSGAPLEPEDLDESKSYFNKNLSTPKHMVKSQGDFEVASKTEGIAKNLDYRACENSHGVLTDNLVLAEQISALKKASKATPSLQEAVALLGLGSIL